MVPAYFSPAGSASSLGSCWRLPARRPRSCRLPALLTVPACRTPRRASPLWGRQSGGHRSRPGSREPTAASPQDGGGAGLSVSVGRPASRPTLPRSVQPYRGCELRPVASPAPAEPRGPAAEVSPRPAAAPARKWRRRLGLRLSLLRRLLRRVTGTARKSHTLRREAAARRFGRGPGGAGMRLITQTLQKRVSLLRRAAKGSVVWRKRGSAAEIHNLEGPAESIQSIQLGKGHVSVPPTPPASVKLACHTNSKEDCTTS